jgi:basic membrane lipoprotein Med (substrate-binding protein (PBP1-ABC) superfamily)
MSKGSLAFKHTIKEYLEDRGSKDPLFARIISKPGKNIDDCVIFIIDEVQKSGCNGFTDDEVYSMAIHYFDEDDVKVGSGNSSMRVVVNHVVELTEDEKKEAHNQAMKEEVEKARAKILKKDKKLEVKKDDKDKPDTITKTLF